MINSHGVMDLGGHLLRENMLYNSTAPIGTAIPILAGATQVISNYMSLAGYKTHTIVLTFTTVGGANAAFDVIGRFKYDPTSAAYIDRVLFDDYIGTAACIFSMGVGGTVIVGESVSLMQFYIQNNDPILAVTMTQLAILSVG